MDYVQHTKLIQQSVRTTPIYNIDRCAGPNILHAKIFILGGAEKLRVVVGSCNLTKNGFERNAELFKTIDIDKDSSDSSFADSVSQFLFEVVRNRIGRISKRNIDEILMKLSSQKTQENTSPIFIMNSYHTSVMD